MTPMMEQYLSIKERHQDAILFFRLGDFYEMFFDDAIVAAKELEIALTKRDMGQQEKAPMCGVPHHSSAGYIEQLVSKGYKVAICEQMEDPKDAKGIVKREVVQVITPGTLLPERSRDENNHLMSLQLTRTGFSVAVVDITTGEFSATAYQDEEEDVYPLLLDEIAKWQPKELLVSDTLYANASFVNEMQERYGAMIGVYDAYSFSEKEQADFIREKMPAMQKGHPLLMYSRISCIQPIFHL
jgi:DNA mismatch repair protein MutS